MPPDPSARRSIFIVGIANLRVLAHEYRTHAIGGAELQQTLLARALHRDGFRVSMVVGDFGQSEGAAWDGIVTHRSYRADAGLPGLRLLHPRATSIWAAMRRADAWIYYCSCADYLPGLVALFARVHRRKAVFRVAHDTDCRPREVLIPNWRGKVLYRYGIRHVDLILAQSEAQQADMLSYFHRTSRVVPSLVELEDEGAELSARDLPVLWVGNMRPFKRPELALELAASMPDVPFHMVGGQDPRVPQLYQHIAERARSLPNVVFEGPQPYDRVEERMRRTRLLINTSEAEGFPNTYLQAWARGTPVVATFDPDGIIQREGLGAAVSTLEQMRSAVRALLQGGAEQWQRISARCRQYVSDRHGASAVRAFADALGGL